MFVNQNTWKKGSWFQNCSSFCLTSLFKNLTRHTFLIIFIVAAIILTELSLHTTFFHVRRFLEANCREASLLRAGSHGCSGCHCCVRWESQKTTENWSETPSCSRHLWPLASQTRPGHAALSGGPILASPPSSFLPSDLNSWLSSFSPTFFSSLKVSDLNPTLLSWCQMSYVRPRIIYCCGWWWYLTDPQDSS